MSLKGSKLIQKALPEYTTERYYVLSEIEQVARFESEDGGDAEGEAKDDEGVTNTANEGEKKHFYYVLWNLHTDGLEKFKKDVVALCGDLRIQGRSSGDCASTRDAEDEAFFSVARTFLAVEVVMPKDSLAQLVETLDTASSSSSGLHKVQQAYEFVQQNFSLDMVAFGACDKLAGTPAIELLQQMVCFTYADLPPTAKVLHALTIDSFLGHDADREPDAESDAAQALFLSRPYTPPTRNESRIDFSQQSPYFHAAVFGFVAAGVLMLAAIYSSKTFHQPLPTNPMADEPEF